MALSLSLGPSLVPFVAALVIPNARSSTSSSRTNLAALKRILRRELGHDGFAFSVTLSVAGGAALKKSLGLWKVLKQVYRVAGGQEDSDDDTKPELRDEDTTTRHTDLFTRLTGWLSKMSPEQETFLCNFLSSSVGVLLLQAGRQRAVRLRQLRHPSPTKSPMDLTSPTLDLTLLLVVRAIDSLMQSFILQKTTPVSTEYDRKGKGREHTAEPRLVHDKLQREKVKQENKSRQEMTAQVDAFVFWACSARIMWCFFYEPQRLPRSYVKWINALANLDGRIKKTLQYIREGSWSYFTGSPNHNFVLQGAATELGYSGSWADPSLLPAYGGAIANEAWKKLGVTSRPGVGGIPCEILHARVGSSLGLQASCTANAALRLSKGFVDALAIYLPVHFLPVLLTRPQILLRPHRLFETLVGALRSATFLSSFLSIYWYTVCLTRSLVLPRIFPFISHDFWDGPYGCIMAGCLMCGSSIWIENGRRRGEMALYVLPKAIRACLPDRWLKSGNRGVLLMERLAFILSMATLLTSAAHRPDSLRGLSRWTLAFVTNGPNAGFWKRKRRDPSVPPTPSVPATPAVLLDARSGERLPHTPNLRQ